MCEDDGFFVCEDDGLGCTAPCGIASSAVSPRNDDKKRASMTGIDVMTEKKKKT